jgi:two-component system response regulator YesN
MRETDSLVLLVVDDEEIIRKGVTGLIQSEMPEFSRVLAASSGEDALEILSQQKVDILLTDICMTNVTGLELSAAVNEKYPNIHVIILTGYDRFEYAQQSIKSGVRDYLLKPIDEDELIQVIREQISEIQGERSKEQTNRIEARAEGVRDQKTLNRLFSQILERHSPTPLAERLREEGYSFDYPMQILIIQPLIQQESAGSPSLSDTEMMIKNTSIRMFDIPRSGVTFEDSEHRICLLVICCGEYEKQIRDLKSILTTELDMPIVILEGGKITSLDQVAYSYREAAELQSISGKYQNEVIRTSEETQRLRLFRETVEELQRRMEEHFGDKVGFMKELTTLLRCMDSYNVSDSMARKTLFLLFCDLIYTDILQNGRKPDQITQCYSVIQSGTRDDLFRAIPDLAFSLFFDEEKHTHDFIQKSIAYINTHLQEELSVMELADSMHITPGYFSRLFKAEVGMGCNE